MWSNDEKKAVIAAVPSYYEGVVICPVCCSRSLQFCRGSRRLSVRCLECRDSFVNYEEQDNT